jgi:membrane associated rhomboid family serine protease
VATLAERARTQATVLLGFIAALWLIELADLLLFRRSLDGLGIRPRDLDSLWSILAAPFLHGGLDHLLANTVPLLGLGWLVLLRGLGTFLAVSALAVLLGGFGVWLLGPPNTIHIGASGLVFGLLGYLLARGFFERRFASILLSVAVGLVYGGALWGLLPGQRGISWQGHLFGFLAGVLAAWLLAGAGRPAGSGGRRTP